jgi:hypothetical protein
VCVLFESCSVCRRCKKHDSGFLVFKLLPNVAVSLPPPSLPVSEETGSSSDDVQPNHSGSLTFLQFLATEITKEG